MGKSSSRKKGSARKSVGFRDASASTYKKRAINSQYENPWNAMVDDYLLFRR